MDSTVDTAIILMDELVQKVDKGQLELTPADWNELTECLKGSHQLLKRSRVTERALEQAARSVIAVFKRDPLLSQHFTDVLDVQFVSKVKETAGRLRKQRSLLTDVQPFENQVVELLRLNEQIEARAQQYKRIQQQSKQERASGQ